MRGFLMRVRFPKLPLVLLFGLLAVSTWGPLPTAWAAEAPLAEPVSAPPPVYGQDTYPGAGEPVPRIRRPIREFFQWMKVELEGTDPFFRDTDLNLHLRTYYRGVRTTTPGTSQEAWAGGGWLEYKSGWWLDTVQIGGTLFGTFPIYAPENRDGTKLLKTGQEGFAVPGIAYGALRYKEYATLTGFRQYVETPYINKQDNRMIPRTNEGVTVGGKLGMVEYYGGYLWTQKERDSDVFKDFAEIAGVRGKERGVILGNLRITPIKDLTLTIHDSYVPDLFNTFYADAGYRLPLAEDLTLSLGAQYTDQRAVGQDLLAVSSFQEWVTYAASGRLALTWKGATLEGDLSLTGSGATIQAPYGGYPGFISELFNDFNRANEFAWKVGLAYDFREVGLPGFTANLKYAQGNNAIDPVTRADAPNERELDLYLAYTIQEGPLRSLRFDARGGILDYTDSGRTGYQLRLILNYEFNLL